MLLSCVPGSELAAARGEDGLAKEKGSDCRCVATTDCVAASLTERRTGCLWRGWVLFVGLVVLHACGARYSASARSLHVDSASDVPMDMVEAEMLVS